MSGRSEIKGQHPSAGDHAAATGQNDRGIGDILRAERERRGVTLEALAKTLKINQAHLAAIEAGRIRELPGKTYAIGFIRSYAKHFGLDPDEAVAALKARPADIPASPELSFLVPARERRRPGMTAWVISSILATCVYGGWQYAMDPPHSLPMVSPLPASPERDGTLAAQPSSSLALADSQDVGMENQPDAQIAGLSAARDPVPGPDESPPRPMATSSQRAGSGPAQAAEAFPTPLSSPSVVEPQAVIDSGSDSASRTIHLDSAGLIPAGSAPKVVLRADEDCWIQVSERGTNRVLLARMLRTGDRVALPGAAKLRLTVGNAGSITVLVDGVAAPPLGPAGSVVRNVSLEGARLLAGTTSSD
jgi:cytoskeleton protein RodZ